MKSIEIIRFKLSDKEIIKEYIPAEWNINFDTFLTSFYDKKYHKGFAIKYESKIVGYGEKMQFGNICWLGIIVIDKNMRNKGLGTQITQHLINEAYSEKATSINLIATALGEFVYKKLGFVRNMNYLFMKQKVTGNSFVLNKSIRKAESTEFQQICDIDFESTNEKREDLLIDYLSDIQVFVNQENRVTGFYCKTLGNGLIAAKEPEAGIELLKLKIIDKQGVVIIPELNFSAKEFLLQNGFSVIESCPRMILGENYNWKPQNIFNRAAGYIG